MQNEFIAECRRWLDTPFHHQGRALGVGVDCAGVIVMAGRAAGVPVVDDLTYDHAPNARRLRAMLAAQPGLHSCALNDEQPGDLLLMREAVDATHLAVQTGPDSILHAYAPARRVIEGPLSNEGRARIVARYRFAWPS